MKREIFVSIFASILFFVLGFSKRATGDCASRESTWSQYKKFDGIAAEFADGKKQA